MKPAGPFLANWLDRRGFSGIPREVGLNVWTVAGLPGFFSSSWRMRPGGSTRGTRIFWTSHLPATDRKVAAVVSSRIGRQWTAKSSWLRALRTTLVRCYRDGYEIVTGLGTTTHSLVERLAPSLSIDGMILIPFPKSISVDWLLSEVAQFQRAPFRLQPIFYDQVRPTDERIAIDEALIAEADEVRVLHVAGRHNTYQGIRNRLETRTGGLVWIRSEGKRKPNKVTAELVERGAIQWTIQGEDPVAAQTDSTPTDRFAWTHLDDCQVDWNKFLIHCTRAPNWSARLIERPKTAIDELVFLDDEVAGPLWSLIQILVDQRIVGSGKLIAQGTPVTCWTAHALPHLPELRRFQKHLARWDFEPYGIAVRKSKFIELGGEPVVYFSDNDLRELSAEKSWLGQPATSTIGGQVVDWSQEREWRGLGDLDLRQFRPDEAFVFVKTREDALEVSSYSRWPVVVMQPGKEEALRGISI